MEFVKEKLIKPATIEEIVEFEKKEKISLPKEYKNFLLKHNNETTAQPPNLNTLQFLGCNFLIIFLIFI